MEIEKSGDAKGYKQEEELKGEVSMEAVEGGGGEEKEDHDEEDKSKGMTGGKKIERGKKRTRRLSMKELSEQNQNGDGFEEEEEPNEAEGKQKTGNPKERKGEGTKKTCGSPPKKVRAKRARKQAREEQEVQRENITEEAGAEDQQMGKEEDVDEENEIEGGEEEKSKDGAENQVDEGWVVVMEKVVKIVEVEEVVDMTEMVEEDGDEEEEDGDEEEEDGDEEEEDGDEEEEDGDEEEEDGDEEEEDGDEEEEDGDGDEEEDEERESEEEADEEKEEAGENFIPLGGARAKGNGRGGISGGDNPPWFRSESIAREFPLRTLHNEMLDLCDLLTPTPDEKARTAIAITYVKRAVRESLGSMATVYIFGSQSTGLVLPNSDVDTVVIGAPYGAITELGRAMHRRSNRGEVRNVVVIAKARVPIVKFVHASTGVQVDVCFDQTSGLKSGAAAREIMLQMPPVRPLVMVLKAYMGQRKLNETYQGGIGSFLLQLMVVALVQKCARDASSKGEELPTNLGFFLDEFFNFYGNQLNYNTTGITLLGQGGGGFFNKREIGWSAPHKPHLLSLQNPHDPSIDVGSNSFKVDVCKKSFQATSLRLRCAFQRAIEDVKTGEGGEGTQGFLKFVVHPGGELAKRLLPPPSFCTRKFHEDKVPDETTDGEVGTQVKSGGAGRLPDERNPFRKARSRMKKMLAEVAAAKAEEGRDSPEEESGGAGWLPTGRNRVRRAPSKVKKNMAEGKRKRPPPPPSSGPSSGKNSKKRRVSEGSNAGGSSQAKWRRSSQDASSKRNKKTPNGRRKHH